MKYKHTLSSLLWYSLPSQVSSNGLVSLDQEYSSWWPVPFPYGRSRVPVLAPLWMDFDFRGSLLTSRIYHNVYDMTDGETLLERAVLDEFDDRLADSGFQAMWLMVVTWRDATPYFWSSRPDEVCPT